MNGKIRKSQYIGQRLTDHYKIFTEASYRHGTQQHQSNFGSDQNPRWPPEINTENENRNILKTV